MRKKEKRKIEESKKSIKLVFFFLALASFIIILIASSYSWSDDSTLVQNVSDCGILNTTKENEKGRKNA